MRAIRLVVSLFVVSMIAAPMSAATAVPFKGTWTGVTVSADGTNFPVVSIVSEGSGRLTHLGHYVMASPHTTNVFTGETLGDQNFTAANGDTLTAYCAGSPTMQPNGTVVGALQCEITGGTGRFAGYEPRVCSRAVLGEPGARCSRLVRSVFSRCASRFFFFSLSWGPSSSSSVRFSKRSSSFVLEI